MYKTLVLPTSGGFFGPNKRGVLCIKPWFCQLLVDFLVQTREVYKTLVLPTSGGFF